MARSGDWEQNQVVEGGQQSCGARPFAVMNQGFCHYALDQALGSFSKKTKSPGH